VRIPCLSNWSVRSQSVLVSPVASAVRKTALGGVSIVREDEEACVHCRHPGYACAACWLGGAHARYLEEVARRQVDDERRFVWASIEAKAPKHAPPSVRPLGAYGVDEPVDAVWIHVGAAVTGSIRNGIGDPVGGCCLCPDGVEGDDAGEAAGAGIAGGAGGGVACGAGVVRRCRARRACGAGACGWGFGGAAREHDVRDDERRSDRTGKCSRRLRHGCSSGGGMVSGLYPSG
jgi:hypothetical protein